MLAICSKNLLVKGPKRRVKYVDVGSMGNYLKIDDIIEINLYGQVFILRVNF